LGEFPSPGKVAIKLPRLVVEPFLEADMLRALHWLVTTKDHLIYFGVNFLQLSPVGGNELKVILEPCQFTSGSLEG